METPTNNPWLSRLAKICVALTLLLIFMGAVVTTGGHGMVSPNAPHVAGSLFPWGEMFKSFGHFAEHGHRLVAMLVGACVGLLTALIWRNLPAFLVAIAFMGLGSIGTNLGWDKATVAHLRVWPAMIIFIVWVIAASRQRGEKPSAVQWLALAVFVCACIQAVVGVLRVEMETAGSLALATNIRTIHGVFAQAFLALLVVIAVRLCPTWSEICARPPHAKLSKFHRMAIAAQLLYFAQLACAAYLRHRDLGLLIPSWPSAQATGGLWPDSWATGDGALRHQLMIHFLHTRILPILLTGHIIGMSIGIIKRAKGETFLTTPAKALLTMIVLQFILGVLVIWRGRQSHITNTHVIVGALICATIAMLAARTSRPGVQTAAA